MEANNIKIPFMVKIKASLRGKTFMGTYKIVSPFYARQLLYLINFIYIFGGWVFLSHYLDIFFKVKDGIASLLSVIVILVINLVIIYLSPYKVSRL